MFQQPMIDKLRALRLDGMAGGLKSRAQDPAALAQGACRDRYTTLYTRAAALFRDLALGRPLCAYREVARYKATGGTDDAANFECALAPQRARKQPRIR